jgi:iron(III) transport system permease protein
VGLLLLASGFVLWECLDGRTARLFANTWRLALAAAAISLPVGTGLALLLVRTRVPGRRLAMGMLGLMLFVPLFLQAAAWDAGFGQQGWVYWGGAPHTDLAPLLAGWWGAVWVHAMAAVPWVFLIVAAGLWFVPRELEEQALLDGTPLQVFWHITLPRVLASVLVAAVWVVVTISGEITVTDIFQVRTFAEELFLGFAMVGGAGENGLDTLRSYVVPPVLVSVWLVVVAAWVTRHLVPADDRPGLHAPRQIGLGAWRCPAAICLFGLLVVIAGVPLGSLVAKAGLIVEQIGDHRQRYWSWSHFIATVGTSPWRYREELAWTLVISQLAATGTVLIAIPLAWCARRRVLLVLLPTAVVLALPGPLIGIGLIAALNQPDWPWFPFLYDRTVLAPCLAMAIRSLPLALLVLWPALRTIASETLDSAATDGAGRLRLLHQIALPQRWGAVVGAWLVAVAVAMGDLAASILVVPPGVTTLSIRVFNLVHYGVEDRLAGICLSTLVLFAALGGGAIVLLRRGEG